MLVAQVCGHEPGVRGEGCTTVVTMFSHISTGNLSRGKAEEEELKAEDGSTLWEGNSKGGAHTGLVQSAASGTSWCEDVVFRDGF
jgi:hypothetical protein